MYTAEALIYGTLYDARDNEPILDIEITEEMAEISSRTEEGYFRIDKDGSVCYDNDNSKRLVYISVY